MSTNQLPEAKNKVLSVPDSNLEKIDSQRSKSRDLVTYKKEHISPITLQNMRKEALPHLRMKQKHSYQISSVKVSEQN